MAWGRINLTGWAGISLDLRLTSYATSGDIPASGSASYVDFAIVSSVACPTIDSGGVMVSSVLSLPTARLDETSLQNGDCVLAYASVGNTTVNINKIFKIMVISIFQFQSGAWVRVPAYVSNHGAAFTKVNLQLYYLGEEFAGVTGGWETSGTYITKNVDNILISAPANQYQRVSPVLRIDLTDVSTLYFKSKFDATRTSPCIAGVTTDISTTSKGYVNRAAGVTLTTSTNQTETALDVSALTGLYYICVWAVDNSNSRGSYFYELRAE